MFDNVTEVEYTSALDDVAPLDDLIHVYAKETNIEDIYFLKEFILWALVEFQKLNKARVDEGYSFRDQYGALFSGL